MSSKKKTYKSAKCGLCGCAVIVWKRKNVSARTLRVLALADHMKTLHASIVGA